MLNRKIAAKRSLLIVLALVMLLSGCGKSKDITVEIVTHEDDFAVEPVEKIEIINETGLVGYLGHYFDTVWDTDVIIIYFEFTNLDDEYRCLHDFAHFEAYQNDVQIDGCHIEVDDEWRNIGKGKMIECPIAFKVNGTSDVTLRVCPIVDGCHVNSEYQEQVLKYSD